MKVNVEKELEQLKATLDKEFDLDNIVVTDQLIRQTLQHITEQNPETPIQKQNKRKKVSVWKIVNITAASFIIFIAAVIWKNGRIFNKESHSDMIVYDAGGINSELEEEKEGEEQIVGYSEQMEENTKTKQEEKLLGETKQEMLDKTQGLESAPAVQTEPETEDVSGDWSRRSNIMFFSFQNYEITTNDLKELSVSTQTSQDTITDHTEIQAYLDYMEQSNLTLQQNREEKQEEEEYILQLQLKNKASELILTLQFYETELAITYYKTETVEYYTGTEYKQLVEQLISIS